MDATAKPIRRRKRRTVTVAEVYIALDALMPFAETEIGSSVDYLKTCFDLATPEDIDYADRGKQALALAQGLIARRTGYIRRQERALKERAKPAAGDDAPPPAFQPEETR